VNRLPIHLGSLRADGYRIVRSGFRWLCAPGEPLRANQAFAYCNISLEPISVRLAGAPAFAEEQELQVAFASRSAGRLVINESEVRGGYLSIRGVQAWDPDDVVAHLEADPVADAADTGRARLLVLAGRRMTGLADVNTGLMPGWHGRTRGWWYEEGESPLSLLSLGICDATGVIIGEKGAFLEMFETAKKPLQTVFVPDHPVMPAARVLLDQINRTPSQFQAIAADFRSYMSDTPILPTHDDWMFSGAMLQVLQRSPIQDSYTVFGATGSSRIRSADAILLSLSSEPQSILRHKKLGYHIQVMRHHQAAAGPAIRSWLGSSFETVKRSIDDIRRDYEALIDAVARTTGGKVMIINRMSTTGHEDISSYAPFDAPMSDTLSSVASKELNLMLHDIAETRDLAIIDVDAIAADIGGSEHLPDGIHQSGAMQAILRGEILNVVENIRPVGTLSAAE
jgi:hypothetical protein